MTNNIENTTFDYFAIPSWDDKKTVIAEGDNISLLLDICKELGHSHPIILETYYRSVYKI
jgi:hypothetical protein